MLTKDEILSQAPRIGDEQIALLEKLSNAGAVSGDEGEVRAIVLEQIKPLVDECRVESTVLGKVGGDSLNIQVNDVEVVSLAVKKLESVWRGAISNKMGQ